VTRHVGTTVTFVSPLLPTHPKLSDFPIRILNPFVGHFRTSRSEPTQ
jgi:hypothetical protein